jgi:hypothetical protein
MKNFRAILLFSVLFFVQAEAFSSPADEKKMTYPFYIYTEANAGSNHGVPSGWMGDFRDLILDIACKDNPHSGKNCVKTTYTAEGSRSANWAGIAWQFPANNEGSIDGGNNLTGAKKLVFWARGEKGGEVIDAFKFGCTLGAYPDSDSTAVFNVVLTKDWKKYEITLDGLDLSYISGFFGWVASKEHNPRGMTFYLDEISIEK